MVAPKRSLLPEDVTGLTTDETLPGVFEIRLEGRTGNRLGWAQIDALATLAERVAALPADGPVRVLLLTAAGDDFSHGADLADGELAGLLAAGDEGRRRLAQRGQQLIETWDRMTVPTVVAARGAAIGAGACLVAASDVRVLAPDARVSFPEVDRGMHLSWGIVPVLAREFGPHCARLLAVGGDAIGRESLPPATWIDGDDARAKSLAVDWAAKPPLAVRAIVRTLRRTQQADPAAAADDAEAFAATVASADFAEAMAAFFERRSGDYQGRSGSSTTVATAASATASRAYTASR